MGGLRSEEWLLRGGVAQRSGCSEKLLLRGVVADELSGGMNDHGAIGLEEIKVHPRVLRLA